MVEERSRRYSNYLDGWFMQLLETGSDPFSQFSSFGLLVGHTLLIKIAQEPEGYGSFSLLFFYMQ